jgi:hypothetical protein
MLNKLNNEEYILKATKSQSHYYFFMSYGFSGVFYKKINDLENFRLWNISLFS